MIDVTDAPLEALVRAAYSPSRQQGLGWLDPSGREDGLTDAEVSEILTRESGHSFIVFSMDYHRGRSVKFTVRKHGDRRYIENSWYDHGDDALRALLETVGLDGGSIDKARAERAAYDEECLTAAIAFLDAAGGSIEQDRGLSDKRAVVAPDEVDAGFWVGRGRGLIKEEFRPGGTTKWSLIERASTSQEKTSNG
jgi:hypothetical protein